jgi:hypothetical protein
MNMNRSRMVRSVPIIAEIRSKISQAVFQHSQSRSRRRSIYDRCPGSRLSPDKGVSDVAAAELSNSVQRSSNGVRSRSQVFPSRKLILATSPRARVQIPTQSLIAASTLQLSGTNASTASSDLSDLIDDPVSASGPPWLLILKILVGLPAALWAYKVRLPLPIHPLHRREGQDSLTH